MNKRQTGSAYEMLAADWLKQHGYQITEKNYRCGQGEIDLIAEKGRVSGFCGSKIPEDWSER